jgi:hypothetical protein
MIERFIKWMFGRLFWLKVYQMNQRAKFLHLFSHHPSSVERAGIINYKRSRLEYLGWSQ